MLKINLARNKTMIILSIISLAFVLLFIKLSMWQFARADAKSQIIEKINHHEKNAVTNLANIQEYSAIKLQGYFDNNKTIVLSNQYSQHRLGYHVVTPFIIQTTQGAEAILIDRGWVSREILPMLANNIRDIESAARKSAIIEISGYLRKSNKNQYIMGENVSIVSPKNSPDLYQIQKINLSDQNLVNLFSYKLSDYYLQLLTPKTAGFDLNWQLINITPQKHKAYAIQWLLLAISVVLLYSYLCYKTYRIEH